MIKTEYSFPFKSFRNGHYFWFTKNFLSSFEKTSRQLLSIAFSFWVFF